MATYTVKNGSALGKAFKVRGGHQVVAAKSEAEVVNARELTEAQIDAFSRDGVKVTAGADDKGLSGMTLPDLKALAEAESIDLGDATKKADIIAAIELAREDKAA